jgi:hypothetical protein
MKMKINWKRCLVSLAIMAAFGFFLPLRAQDKPAAAAEMKKTPVPLKVGVVVTELDGAKKISSLPYTFYVNTDDSGRGSTSSVRVGLRVPVATGSGGAGAVSTQFQYMDIGTNLDCAASSTGDGRFKLYLSVDRSYLTGSDDKKTPGLAGDGVSISSGNPIVQHFSSSYNLVIRDGQTIEATSTTDPITGRVLQISVTTNVVK